MERKELIEVYLKFFESKDHKRIGNASLIPENDSTVLFTTAGMHPLVPFLLGQEHPSGKRLCNVQRCIRTGDIDEVGDCFHHTFFEMLGNWSLGDYFKEEAIKFSFEFLTRILNIPLNKLAVTCFKGDKQVSRDEEAASIWKKLGIEKDKIFFLGRENNWWGPAGKTGPCGPDTEMFFYLGDKAWNDISDPDWVEIWNDVFMQFNKNDKGEYRELKQKNVDTGMGVERTLAVLNGFSDDYLTECFYPVIVKIEELSGKDYEEEKNKRAMRIIADHVKASVFILNEGIEPSNTEHGYVLRRLIRRAIRYGKELGIKNFLGRLAREYFKIYPEYKLKDREKFIISELDKEEERFDKLLEDGLKYFSKIIKGKKKISGESAFLLYQSYGFPLEMTKEIAKEKKLEVDEAGFEKEYEKHQEASRGSSGRFKSGLADSSEATTRLHTATHLLNEALRRVLEDKGIYQKGSNITPERLRFDFNFPRKLTSEELKRVEELVNEQIKAELEVKKEEMSLEKAKKIAQGVFESKYGERVFVYSIGNFSREICAGPHVDNTKELGKFKIIKEEGVAAGVRRIKATLS